MPTPVQQYMPLSVAQVSPLAYSVSQLPSMIQAAQEQSRKQSEADLMNQLRQQQIAQNDVQMKYLEPGLQEDLKQKQLSDALNSIRMQQIQQEIKYYPEKFKADTAYKNAMAQYLNSPNQMLKNVSNYGKTILEPYVISDYLKQGGKLSNIPIDQDISSVPNIGSTAINEINQENNGNPTSNIFEDYANLRKGYTLDPVSKRNAVAANQLINEINEIDLEPLKKFSGLWGMGKKGINAAEMALNIPGLQPSEDYRDYDAFQKVTKNALMDTVRKTLATSVVPDYVKETIAPMIDPTSGVINDPKQVQKRFDVLKKWINQYASIQTKGASKGYTGEEYLSIKKPNNSPQNEQYNVKMYDPSGKPVLVHQEDAEEALKSGYRRR